MSESQASARSWAVPVTLVLTVIWMALSAIALANSDHCPNGDWPWDRLSCLSPNEFGDYLAGSFAPLAFLWLVAAVLLQRGELQAQREELRLTRDEMVETRRVLEQQRKEAEKSATYIGKQTDILEQESRLRAVSESDKNTDELTKVLSGEFRRLSERNIIHSNRDFTFEHYIGPLTIGISQVNIDDPYRQIVSYGDQLNDSIREFERHNTSGVTFQRRNKASMDLTLTLIDRIQEFSNAASIPRKTQVEMMKLARLRENITYILGIAADDVS